MNELNVKAPVKQRRVQSVQQPVWFNKEIANCISKRNNFKHKGDTSNYRLYRNRCANLIKMAKINYYQQTLKSAKGNSKKVWSCIKELSGGLKSKQTIAKVIHDDIEHSNPEKIANLFNVHFSNAAERVLELAGITESDEYVPSLEFRDFLSSKNIVNNQFGIPLITRNEVLGHA